MRAETVKFTMPLPATHHSSGLARQAVRQGLCAAPVSRFVDDALLLTSELVSNAIVHTRQAFWLAFHFDPHAGYLRIEVTDSSRQPPTLVELGSRTIGGFGLRLIDLTASRWGSKPTATGKAVWFELHAAR